MTPLREPNPRIGDSNDGQITTRNNSGATYIECPRTPENREAPQINHPPGPKADVRPREEQESPIQSFLHRTRYRRSDSAYASRESSIDRINIKEKSTAPCAEVCGPEVPKTPPRNNAALHDENNSRSASPKKGPSVDRRRLQSRYYRARSPPMQRPARVLFPIGDVDEIMSNTFGVELIRLDRKFARVKMTSLALG
jgi:hypothetical protein